MSPTLSKQHLFAILASLLFLALTIFGHKTESDIVSTIVSSIPPWTNLAQVAPTGGLTNYYSFDGNAIDSVGGNNGTASGNPSYVSGKIGQAVSLNGISDMFGLSSDPLGTGTVTIAMWIYPRSYSTGRGTMIWGNSTRFRITNVGNRPEFSSDGFSHSVVAGNSTVTLNAWNHVVVVRDSSNMATIYVNGTQSGASNQDSGIPTGGTIGAIGESYGGSNRFDGLIDEVRIYNRPLGASEVTDLFIATGEGTPPPPPPPDNTPINGVCSTTLNSCTAGTFSDVPTDTTTDNNWSCLGINNGTTAICSTPKIVNPPPSTGIWYVDSNVTTSGDGKTWATAWKTFDDIVWTSIKPGHTIWVSGGTYTGRLAIGASGVKGSPVKIAAARDAGHNSKVILNGRISLMSSQYVTIDGSKSDSHNITTAASTIGLADPNSNINWQINNGDNIIIVGQDIVGVTLKWLDLNGTPGYVSGATAISMNGNDVAEVEIAYNYIHDTGQDGIYGNNKPRLLTDLNIHHNYITRTGDDGMELSGGMRIHDNRIELTTKKNGHPDALIGVEDQTEIYNNIIGDYNNALAFVSFKSTNSSHVWFWNNFLYTRYVTSSDPGITIGTDGTLIDTTDQHWSDIRIVNNTLYNVTYGISFYNRWAPSMSAGTALNAYVRDAIVANNLIVDPRDIGISLKGYPASGVIFSQSDVTVKNNVITGTRSTLNNQINYLNNGALWPSAEAFNAGTGFTGNTNARPHFADSANYNLHLSSADTVAKDAGANLASLGIYTDQEGTSRPQGLAWDIGAYEYYSGSPTYPINNPVDGICSATLNTCTTGTFSDLTDTTTHGFWSCAGFYGGSTASCSKSSTVEVPIPVTAPVVTNSQIVPNQPLPVLTLENQVIDPQNTVTPNTATPNLTTVKTPINNTNINSNYQLYNPTYKPGTSTIKTKTNSNQIVETPTENNTDIAVPTTPSWLEVLRDLLIKIFTRILGGIQRTVEVVKGVF